MSQRDRLADYIEEWLCQSFEFGEDVSIHAMHQSGADALSRALLARGVRIVTEETLAQALDDVDLKTGGRLHDIFPQSGPRRVATAILAALDEQAPQEAER